MSGESRRHLAEALALVRRRGYAMAANGPAMRALRKARILKSGQARDAGWRNAAVELSGRLSLPELQLGDPRDAGPEGVDFIAAPVFSPTGPVNLQLAITGLSANLDRRTLARFAERLCSVAATITSATYGHGPDETEWNET